MNLEVYTSFLEMNHHLTMLLQQNLTHLNLDHANGNNYNKCRNNCTIKILK